jgi:undecaprenyl-diphosphatase
MHVLDAVTPRSVTSNTAYIWPILLLVLAIMLGIAVTLGIGKEVDRTLLKAIAFRDGSTDGLEISVAQWITWAGDAAQRSLVMVGFACWLAWRKRRRAALVTLVAVSLAGVASSLLKEVFARPRPAVVPHLDIVTNLSYPSGHAVNAMAVFLLGALLLAKTRRSLWIMLAILAAAVVGASRMALGVHYPSDVLGGWLLGAAFALFAWRVAVMLELSTEPGLHGGQDAIYDDVNPSGIGVDPVGKLE